MVIAQEDTDGAAASKTCDLIFCTKFIMPKFYLIVLWFYSMSECKL